MTQKKSKVVNKVFKKYDNRDMTKYGWYRFKNKDVVIKKDSVWLKDLMKDKKPHTKNFQA